jgi:hypothetical protein
VGWHFFPIPLAIITGTSGASCLTDPSVVNRFGKDATRLVDIVMLMSIIASQLDLDSMTLSKGRSTLFVSVAFTSICEDVLI